ncbi:hypothetical protein LOZ80_30030 [Paenibacillus sp. HWE-109]|uniref:hypothetical protein n=1 Tax=Paenibacillus sp. HWE-109 TaxID=1306526 RepID=UPI001EDDA6F4|nr:hypothetical protein [Paenibacillus sp. HWE-109]UKS25761.1 hypothetical protein LOZ80_30030 [Paenibacillus sp. HWE-109]
MRRYFTAFFVLISTLLLTRLWYYMIDPLRVLFSTPKNLIDKLIESAILIFVMIIITIVYKVYYKLLNINKFILCLWGAVILFVLLNTGTYIFEDFENKQYQKTIDENSLYYKQNLKDGFSIVSIEQFGGQTLYIFKKNASLSKEDMNYLLQSIRPLNDIEDITIELISTEDNKQSTMRYSASKKFLACRDANYAASSIPNICLK